MAPPTLDGVLGGFGVLDDPDVAFSLKFLKDLRGDWNGAVVADVAAGIGRVTKHLLLPLNVARVDVLEQSSHLLAAAPAYVDENNNANMKEYDDDDPAKDEESTTPRRQRCRYVCVSMQAWRPKAREYDLIWIQWCVGHLTDSDFLDFLNVCRRALKKTGLLVIKDNSLHAGTYEKHLAPKDDGFYVDDDDRSVCRSFDYYRALFDVAQAAVLAEAPQPVDDGSLFAFPPDIYPVFTWALYWPQDHTEKNSTHT